MKIGAERSLDNLLTFLSPFLYTQYPYLTYEVTLHWPIPTFSSFRQRHLGQSSLACPAKQIASQERIVKFVTDTKPIRVDNRCSACISPYIEDFIGPLEDTNKTIKGFAGARTNNPKIGTLRWQW